MKTLIAILIGAAALASCTKEEPILPDPEYVTARLEVTFRDSGGVSFDKPFVLDTIVDSTFVYEWDAVVGSDLVVLGSNYGGIGDSVVLINLYISGVIDTSTWSSSTNNSVGLYTTLE
jgi:hypothetical protein